MRKYPTTLEMPSRKQRKAQRKKIFAENQDAMKVAKEARKVAKRV